MMAPEKCWRKLSGLQHLLAHCITGRGSSLCILTRPMWSQEIDLSLHSADGTAILQLAIGSQTLCNIAGFFSKSGAPQQGQHHHNLQAIVLVSSHL